MTNSDPIFIWVTVIVQEAKHNVTRIKVNIQSAVFEKDWITVKNAPLFVCSCSYQITNRPGRCAIGNFCTLRHQPGFVKHNYKTWLLKQVQPNPTIHVILDCKYIMCANEWLEFKFCLVLNKSFTVVIDHARFIFQPQIMYMNAWTPCLNSWIVR